MASSASHRRAGPHAATGRLLPIAGWLRDRDTVSRRQPFESPLSAASRAPRRRGASAEKRLMLSAGWLQGLWLQFGWVPRRRRPLEVPLRSECSVPEAVSALSLCVVARACRYVRRLPHLIQMCSVGETGALCVCGCVRVPGMRRQVGVPLRWLDCSLLLRYGSRSCSTALPGRCEMQRRVAWRCRRAALPLNVVLVCVEGSMAEI